MLRDDAVTRIQRGLGFRTDRVAEIEDALREAQRKREAGKTLPWFLVEEDTIVTLAAAAQNVALPEGFLRFVAGEGPHYTTVDSDIPFYVPVKNLREATEAYGDHDAAGPQVVVLRGSVLRFFPVADQAYSITFSYYKAAAVLSSNIENAWLEHAPDLMIGDAGLILAADLRDSGAIQIFQKLQADGLDQAFKETILREDDGEDLYLGANH